MEGNSYVRLNEINQFAYNKRSKQDGFIVLGDILDRFHLHLQFRKTFLYVVTFFMFAFFWPFRDPLYVSLDRTKSMSLLTSYASISVPLTGGGTRDLDSWTDVSSNAEAVAYFQALGGLLFADVQYAKPLVDSTEQPMKAWDGTYSHGVSLLFLFLSDHKDHIVDNVESYLNSLIPASSSSSSIEWDCYVEDIHLVCTISIYGFPYNATYGESCYFAAINGIPNALFEFQEYNLEQTYSKLYVAYSNSDNNNFYETVFGGWVGILKYTKLDPTSNCYKISFVTYDSSIVGIGSGLMDILSLLSFIILVRIMVLDYDNYTISSSLMVKLDSKYELGFGNGRTLSSKKSIVSSIQFLLFGWRIVDLLMFISMLGVFICRVDWYIVMADAMPEPDDFMNQLVSIEGKKLELPSYMRYIQSVTAVIIGFRCLLCLSTHPAIHVYFLTFQKLIPKLSIFLVLLLSLIFITAIVLTDVFRQTGGNPLFKSLGSSINSIGLLTFGNLGYFEFFNGGVGFGVAQGIIILVFWGVAFYSFIFAQNMMLALVTESYECAKKLFDDSLSLLESDVNVHQLSELTDSSRLSDDEKSLTKSRLNDFAIRKYFNDLTGYETNPYYGKRSSHPLKDFIRSTSFELSQLLVQLLMLLSRLCRCNCWSGMQNWVNRTFEKDVAIGKSWDAIKSIYTGFYNPYTECLDHRGILNHSGSAMWYLFKPNSSNIDLEDKIYLATVNFLNLPLTAAEYAEFIEYCYQFISVEHADDYPSFVNEIMLKIPNVLSICRPREWKIKDGGKDNREMSDSLFFAFKRNDCPILRARSRWSVGSSDQEMKKKANIV